jgi:predicted sulfurtransferase
MTMSKLAALVGAVVATGLVALGVRNTPATPAPVPVPVAQDGAGRTSPRELAEMLNRGEAIVLDVRDVDAYLAGHIEGALHIPLSYIPGEVPYLKRGKRIVTYCT